MKDGKFFILMFKRKTQTKHKALFVFIFQFYLFSIREMYQRKNTS